MKTVFLIISGVLVGVCSHAQNLVPNYSFEIFSLCPESGGEIYKASPWFQPNIYFNSSDYFHNCNNGSLDVPLNFTGYQNARTGVGYAGIILYYDSANEYREYVEVQLNSALLPNKKYCVEFYVSQANESRFGINSFHALFTKDSALGIIEEALPFVPQVKNTTGIIEDTISWILISGQIIAEGGEQFLTIGNFNRNDSTQYAVTNSSSVFNYWGYYYIDDVSATLCDTTAIEEKAVSGSGSRQLAVYPNPAITSATVTVREGNTIVITDITGRKMKEYSMSGNQLKIDTDEFNNGIYFLALYSNNVFVATEKLVVAK